MDLTSPIRSVIPSVHGDVLAVLARTERSLTGRRVAELTNGRVSQKGANLALRALSEAGLVDVEDHPPAKLYSLNRRHLAAAAIIELTSLRERLLDGIRSQLASWSIPVWGAWIFGSAARADGDASSDIDVLIVRPDGVDEGNDLWLDQVERFATEVTAWTGNRCEVSEYARKEFDALLLDEGRLARDLRSDGIALTERRLS